MGWLIRVGGGIAPHLPGIYWLRRRQLGEVAQVVLATAAIMWPSLVSEA